MYDPPAGPPGVRFVYSDINFILLGELVHRLSGQTLADYARDNVFRPLGMKETMFSRGFAAAADCADRALAIKDGAPLRGWYTTRRRATWAALRDTPGYSPRPTTWRGSRK